MATFHLISFHHIEGRSGATCQNCGHEIRNVFTIADQDGTRMEVGSECVILLTSGSATQDYSALIVKRVKRAESQYRANKPERLAGEDKTAYVNRRLTEMANAWNAHKAWVADCNRLLAKRAWKIADRAKRLGAKIDRAAIFTRHSERIARRWHANPFDFQQVSWKVKKI